MTDERETGLTSNAELDAQWEAAALLIGLEMHKSWYVQTGTLILVFDDMAAAVRRAEKTGGVLSSRRAISEPWEDARDGR